MLRRAGSAWVSLVAALAVALTATLLVPVTTAGVRLQARQGRTDLMIIAFAVFQTNLTRELEAFFDSADGLPAEFDNRQVLNVRVDGQLADGVTVDARVHHDRENVRDWRYLVRLNGAHNSLAVGELDGAFLDTSFTRYDTPYYGVEGRLQTGQLATSGFATTRAGNFRVDRLRGTNLSGPYILSASPVLEGSERIAIEVRDRLDSERVIRSDYRNRDRDYLIDYFTGSILFSEPVEAETFDGNPVQIVVEYQFVSRADSGSELLTGSRVVYEPSDKLRLGTTYLKSTGGTGALSKDGIVGFDQHVAIGSFLTFDGELAGPGGAVFDPGGGAIHLGLSVRPRSDLELRGRFRRVGNDFVTQANPRLDSELDRQEWEVAANYAPRPEHRLTAAYGIKSDNVADDPELVTTLTRTLALGWEARMEAWPVLRGRYERRLAERDGENGSLLQQLTFDFEDELGRWPVLGPTRVRGQYRLENEDGALGLGDTGLDGTGLDDTGRRAHGVRLRFDSAPIPPLQTFIEMRRQWSRVSSGASASTELIAGGSLSLDQTLSAGTSLRLRRDGAAEGAGNRRTTAIFDLRWEPGTWLRGIVKYEWTLSGVAADSELQSRNLYGHLVVQPTSGLQLASGYKLDDQSDPSDLDDDSSDGEYFLSILYDQLPGFTLYGRAERGRSEERLPPFPTTRSARETFIFGSAWDVTRHWTVLAELKHELLTGATESRRRAVVLELGRNLTTYLKLAGGLEYTLDQRGEGFRVDRQRLYLKLVGRL